MIREYAPVDLSDRNSFQVRQQARRLVEFETAADLRAIFSQRQPDPWYVLSGGNNILFTRDYDGTLLTPVSRGIETIGEDARHVAVRVDAGVEWDDLVVWAVEHDLWGVENLSLIPGKVGAAPVQNIGAYGAEAKDTIRNVEVFCPQTLNTLILARDHCDFGYRDSVFKRSLRGRAIITAVTFELSRTPQPEIGYGDVAREVERRGGPTLIHIREAICDIRRRKLPDTSVAGNAGSFFKNPVVERPTAERLRAAYPEIPLYPASDPQRIKLAAGWLIEQAGMKGYTEGRVGVHDRQALVLVNYGGATGGEVIALARKVQDAVREKFGIAIETEVNVL